MSAGGETPHHHVGQPGNTTVGPGAASVWSDVEDTKGPHCLEDSHMPVATTREVHSVPARRPLVFVAAGSAALMAVIVYLNVLDNPFVVDDFRLIVENESMRTLSDVETVIVRDVTRPLVNLSYVLDTAGVGQDPVRVSPDQPAVARRQRRARLLGGFRGLSGSRSAKSSAPGRWHLADHQRAGRGQPVRHSSDVDAGRGIHCRALGGRCTRRCFCLRSWQGDAGCSGAASDGGGVVSGCG